MSQTTIASSGSARLERVEERRPPPGPRSPAARARRGSGRARRRWSDVEPAALASALRERGGRPRGVGLHHARRAGSSSRRRAGSTLIATRCGGCGCFQPWVIIPSRSLPIATTTSASSHSSPASGTCGDASTRQGCPGGSRPLRGVGEDHRRHEPLRQPRDRLARPRLKRAAAGPDRAAARARSSSSARGARAGRLDRGLTGGRPRARRGRTPRRRPPRPAGRSGSPRRPAGAGGASAVAIARVTAGPMSSAELHADRLLHDGLEHRRLVGGLVEHAAPHAGAAQRVAGCRWRSRGPAGARPTPRRRPPSVLAAPGPGGGERHARAGRSRARSRRPRRRRSARGARRPAGSASSPSARQSARLCTPGRPKATSTRRRPRAPPPRARAPVRMPLRWRAHRTHPCSPLARRARGRPVARAGRPLLHDGAGRPRRGRGQGRAARGRRRDALLGPAVRGRRGRLLPVGQPRQAHLRDRPVAARGRASWRSSCAPAPTS